MSTFKGLNELLKRLHHRYYNARKAFSIFEALEKARSPRHAGKRKVTENVAIMNTYGHFFLVAKEAVRIYFFLELAKFFDKNARTNSVWNLLDKIEHSLPHLTKVEFLAYRESEGSPVLPELEVNYKPLNRRFIADVKRSLRSVADTIEKLKNYRDTHIAHDDVGKSQTQITRQEIVKTFNVIETVFNKLSLRTEFATWSYDGMSERSERHTKLIISRLNEWQRAWLKKNQHRFR